MGDSLRPVLVIAGALALGSGAAILVFGGDLMDAQPPPPHLDNRSVSEVAGQLDPAFDADDVSTGEPTLERAGDLQAAADRDAPDRDAPPGVDLAQVGAPGPWRAGARDASGARLKRLGDRERGPDTGVPAKTSVSRGPAVTVRDGVDDAFRAMGVPQPPSHADMPSLDQPLGEYPAAPGGRSTDTAAPPSRQPSEADSG